MPPRGVQRDALLAPPLVKHLQHNTTHDQPPVRQHARNAVALRSHAIDVAAGLDVRGAPAVAAAVLAEVARRDSGAGMSDRAFEAWLDAVARIRLVLAG